MIFTNEDVVLNLLSVDTFESGLYDILSSATDEESTFNLLVGFYRKVSDGKYFSPPLTKFYCLVLKTLLDLINLRGLVVCCDCLSSVISNATYWLGLSSEVNNIGFVDFRDVNGRYIVVKDMSKCVRISPV